MVIHKFIDEFGTIYTDEEATERLRKKNDSSYLQEHGVVRVDKERWLEAQRYEDRIWRTPLGQLINCDRTDAHVWAFNWFNSILYQKFYSAIEVGCGPFTNMRILQRTCKIDEITLIDPLIYEYLDHPNCTYGLGKEIGDPVLVDLPFEEYDITDEYDLAVMVNTIDHCYDAEKILTNLWSCMKRGGVVVFAEEFWNQNRLRDVLSNEYDSGHPIKLLRPVLDMFLSLFDEIYKKTFIARGDEREDGAEKAICYFIGRKK